MHDLGHTVMITQFRINHFKSLMMKKPVTLNPGLNLMIGLNSSGKSTFLQAIDFVSALPRFGGYRSWLDKRGWEAKDLACRVKSGPRSRSMPLIEFEAVYEEPGDHLPYQWSGAFSVGEGRCETEKLNHGAWRYEYAKKGEFYVVKDTDFIDAKPAINPLSFHYEGSFFSIFESEKIQGFRKLASNCYSLDLLSPQQMRAHVRRRSEAGVGTGGELLGHALLDLSESEAEKLAVVMRRFHPVYESFDVKKQRGGSVRFSINEKFADGISRLETEATHISDGLLRLIAIIVSTMRCRGGTLLIDELEDGLNPEVMEPLLHYLAYDAGCQTIVTTHSPILLSYLNDEQAHQAVKLLFKDEAGMSRCVPFFDLPTTKKMLDTLYPGEVMLQCDLNNLSEEACAYAENQQ